MKKYTVLYTVTCSTEVWAETHDEAFDRANQFASMNKQRTIIDVIPNES
jgi:hypothetical protein